jgi:hypothetical protein
MVAGRVMMQRVLIGELLEGLLELLWLLWPDRRKDKDGK